MSYAPRPLSRGCFALPGARSRRGVCRCRGGGGTVCHRGIRCGASALRRLELRRLPGISGKRDPCLFDLQIYRAQLLRAALLTIVHGFCHAGEANRELR